MKIVIAGASGFIGRHLTAHSHRLGHSVVRLVRGDGVSQPGTAPWDPARGQCDPAVLAGADGVVCLSGASVLGWPWTNRYREELVRSRITTARTLVRAIEKLPDSDRPKAFLCGSATGYYGPDNADQFLDESSARGVGFLARLCEEWEQEARKASDLTRVVNLRTGLVMGSDGGMLGPLSRIYRYGGGATLGDGSSWMPVIGIRDHVRAVLFAMQRESIVGPVNLVGPTAVRNKDFNAMLARVVRRPAILRVPRFAILGVLGDAGREAVLASARVTPGVLDAENFAFEAPTLEEMLREALT
ncbi:TIGR01777 family oxidoreductase [Arcanobacterium wilhelmae]|uniref:TIGR01777 family oxidoreductase n=1 Tax=Arcanobacterium wilhelmae TaxID=1803177 RepID=UPI002415406A|nr:TIGR01777 family oxidoreductase [Arcanobacterium wilhelmae]WFN89653.1 TIGR01777 family oxidoreductase [Arcanobacterium wilhelmae]